MKRWHWNLKGTPDLSVVMAVYNKPRELGLCLEGYRRQSYLLKKSNGIQLILADDGSGAEIEKIFLKFAREVPFPCTYLRQEDRGWGKLRMLNWATLEARAERIAFTDGDCIPHRHFVRSYAEARDSDTVYCGRRVDLMEKIAPRIALEDVRRGTLESPSWLWKRISADEVDYGEQGFYLPRWISAILPLFNRKPTLLGSNFSIAREKLIALNGFDESFSKPGYGEDTDLERRLLMAGMKLKWITHRAIQYHLWHPLTPVRESKRVYEKLKVEEGREATQGIKQFLPEYQKIPTDSRF